MLRASGSHFVLYVYCKNHPLDRQCIFIQINPDPREAVNAGTRAKKPLHEANTHSDSALTIQVVGEIANFVLGGRHVPEPLDSLPEQEKAKYRASYSIFGHEMHFWEEDQISRALTEDELNSPICPGTWCIRIPDERGARLIDKGFLRFYQKTYPILQSKKETRSEYTDHMPQQFWNQVFDNYRQESNQCLLSRGIHSLNCAHIIDLYYGAKLYILLSITMDLQKGKFSLYHVPCRGPFGFGDIRSMLSRVGWPRDTGPHPANHYSNGIFLTPTLRKQFDEHLWVLVGDVGIWLSSNIDRIWALSARHDNTSSIDSEGSEEVPPANECQIRAQWNSKDPEQAAVDRNIPAAVKTAVGLLYNYCPQWTQTKVEDYIHQFALPSVKKDSDSVTEMPSRKRPCTGSREDENSNDESRSGYYPSDEDEESDSVYWTQEDELKASSQSCFDFMLICHMATVWEELRDSPSLHLLVAN